MSAFLIFAMILSSIPALTMETSAAVSSSIVSGEKMQYIAGISTSGGTTRLSVDNLRGNLNRKSSKAADYWLYADFTSNADEAITGIWIMGSDSPRASVNVNSEGRSCYIYYTKDKNAGAPIASVGVWQSEDDYFEYVTNVGTELQEYYDTSFNNQYSDYGYTNVGGDHTDLNSGAGSKTAYVYLYYKRAPYVKTQTAEFCYDGQPHNGSVTVSDGATVTYGAGISAIGSYTQTFKVTKDGMLPISGTTQVVINNHDYSVSLNNKVAASCKAAGHETDMKCSKCGAVKEGAIIPKLEHTYKNVFCTVCGALEEGYTQIKTSSTYYKIVGDTIYIDGKGEIPYMAFRRQTGGIDTTITKAVIGDSITGIATSAFNRCKSLTSVTIPNSVTSIGDSTFLQCSSLTSITIPGSVKSIERNAFSKCTSLKTVVIENGVTSISDYMFNSCSALTSVTIPNTVTSIGAQAFYGTNLTSVTIPNSVTSLASNAFNGTKLLKQATLPCRLNYSFANGVRVTKVHVGDAVTDASKAPTCTENGLTEGTHCSVCGKAIVAQEVITASGHIWGSWNVWQESSCTSTGIRGRFCERCYAEETEEIPMTDHYWGGWNEMRPASCAENGMLIRYCDRCKTSETKETPKTNDHIFAGEYRDNGDGNHSRKCTRCDVYGAAEHHSYENYVCPCGAENAEAKAREALTPKDSSTVIDTINGYIYGLNPKVGPLLNYVTVKDGYTADCVGSQSNSTEEIFGTGSVLNVYYGNTKGAEFTLVIFGDVNGDGLYDGMDAMIVNCIANGMMTKEDVGEAVYMAADCNHDGAIDQLDVDILQQAGVLLSQVDQSKSEEELLETSSAYVEYLNLIEQNVSVDEGTTDEPVVEPYNPSPMPDYQLNIFEKIIAFFMAVWKYIFSFMPV